jgi:hypothetical protein
MSLIPAHPLSAFVRAGALQPLAVSCICKVCLLVRVFHGTYNYYLHAG